MKRLRWIWAFVPVIGLAQMNISISERVATQLVPDVLEGSVNFDEQAKNGNTIKQHLNAIVAELKRQDPQAKLCRGGGYRISPVYSYKNQKAEFTGYSGSLGFSCEFESIEQYNTLMAAIDGVTAPEVRKNLAPLRWGVSDKAQEEAQMQLRTALMEKVGRSAQKFSEDTKMECVPVAVRIGGTSPVMPMQMRSVAMAMSDSVSTESPIQGNEVSSLEASVEYGCSVKSHQ